MDETLTTSFIPQPWVLGAIAFVLTSLHAILCFPLYAKLLTKFDRHQGIRILFFLSGCFTTASWLIYLWHLNNLYIKVGLGLHLMPYVVFLIQAMIINYTKSRLNRSQRSKLKIR